VALLLVTMIGVTMLDAGPKPSAATQAGPQPAAAAVPAPPAAETSPKAVVYAAFRAAAAGDAQGLIARFDRVTPAQAQTLTEVAQVMSAADRLSDAVAERFGVDVEQQFARALGTGVASFDVASAMETIRGDRATVELNAGPGDIELVRSGQTWKISSQALRTLNAGGVRQLRAGVPAIEQLTADVRAGKYKTIGELHQAAGRLMQAMRNRPATTRAATTAPSAGHTATPPPQNAAN
jgi:hypothetical protein